jgi:copper chaperone CopZ
MASRDAAKPPGRVPPAHLERSIVDPTPASPRPASPPEPSPRPFATRIAFLLVVAGVLAVIGFVTWQGTLRGRVAGSEPAEAGTVTLAIDGMSCVGCAGVVTSTLEDVPGVAEVTVDYERRLATIRMAGEPVEPATLVAAIEEAGYKARIER